MSKNIILFVFEGDKPENYIFDSIKRTFFNNNDIVIRAAYHAGLFQLCQNLSEDPFLDLVELLKEKDNENLFDIKRSQVSEIYLFFDYDPQRFKQLEFDDFKKYNDDIKELLSILDNETELGKLFINYPMVEALKCCNSNDEFLLFEDHIFYNLNDLDKFKEYTGKYLSFNNYRKYNYPVWEKLIKIHIKRLNYIVNCDYEMPLLDSYNEDITRHNILKYQIEKFIKTDQRIMISSPFPLFLLDYFGERLYRKISN